MRTGAVVCFAIAAIGTIMAIRNIVGEASQHENVGHLVRYAVGAFLIPTALLIVGLFLWGKNTKQ